MQLKKISTRKDYNVALQRFEKIFQAKNGSKESDEADVLSVLLKDYETNTFEILSIVALWELDMKLPIICGKSKIDSAKIIGITPAWLIRSGK